MIARTRKLLKDNSGVAMIYSLVIGIVVAIFAVMLLMVTYSLFAQTSRQTGQTQCRIMADTFAESLANELMDEDSELHEFICTEFATHPVIELKYTPDDINYEIEVKLTYEEATSTDDDSDDGLIIDDNDQDVGQPGPSVTPGAGVTPGVTPGGTPGLSGETLVIAEITCYKGGTQGIAVQSYTVTQKCKVEMND